MQKKVQFQNVPNKKCIIEFQSFWGNLNEFIVKELVIMDLSTNVVNYFLFKAPHSIKKLCYKAKKTNNWLTKNYHYISWNEGFVNYKELDNIMYFYCQQYGVIYTTGLQKTNWIQQYTPYTVINYFIKKSYVCDFGEGFCNSVSHNNHKVSNCSLIKTYRLLTAMGKIPNSICQSGDGNGGGGDRGYINHEDSYTYHEFYGNTCTTNNCKKETFKNGWTTIVN